MHYKIKELHKLITTLKNEEVLSDYGVLLLEGYAVGLEIVVKNAVRRGINISDCKKGIVNIGDKVNDKDGEECWISDWFDGIVEVDYRNEKWSVKGQYHTVYLPNA